MTTIRIVVPVAPVGQPRPRVTTIGGSARMYEAAKSHPIHAFKAAVRRAYPVRNMFVEPVKVCVVAWFPRTKAETWKTKPMLERPHVAKPDADNVLKAVLDALNGVAWVDDSQVYSAMVIKMVCGGDTLPRVDIDISGEVAT